MSEVFFYHLKKQPIDVVLPVLLEKTIERNWRAIVHTDNLQRIESIDQLLWTYRDGSFLPHGTYKDINKSLQPILLTLENDNPNNAEVRFFIDGTGLEDISSYKRVIHLFDDSNLDAISKARNVWRQAKSNGYDVSYWQQNENNKWQKISG